MTRRIFCAVALSACSLCAYLPAQTTPPQATSAPPASRPAFDTFDVATVKPIEHDPKGARYLLMQSPHRFVAKDYSLKMLIAAAYDLNPHAVLGGPPWLDSSHFDIAALTPGEVKPTREEQMKMLRALLSDRFQLAFHREQKVFTVYELSLAKSGSKIKPSAAPPDQPPALISVVYPQKIVLPARNATMTEFALILQRAILDKPVVDKTGLTGRYDFDLEWAPDETQFDGEVPVASSDAPSPPLFTAMQEQLGLRLQTTREPIAALVVDSANQPSAN